jgi:hypothetical protein
MKTKVLKLEPASDYKQKRPFTDPCIHAQLTVFDAELILGFYRFHCLLHWKFTILIQQFKHESPSYSHIRSSAVAQPQLCIKRAHISISSRLFASRRTINWKHEITFDRPGNIAATTYVHAVVSNQQCAACVDRRTDDLGWNPEKKSVACGRELYNSQSIRPSTG